MTNEIMVGLRRDIVGDVPSSRASVESFDVDSEFSLALEVRFVLS